MCVRLSLFAIYLHLPLIPLIFIADYYGVSVCVFQCPLANFPLSLTKGHARSTAFTHTHTHLR